METTRLQGIDLADLTDEELSKSLVNDLVLSPEFINVLRKAAPYVADYCKKHNTEFKVLGTRQNSVFEPAFLFAGREKAMTYDDLRQEFDGRD